jgi:phage shock protein PspC (stress-responsive transcriptional regulator)
MFLLRLTLIFLIIFLLVRAFIIAGSIKEPEEKKSDQNNFKEKSSKGVPKGIGEYIDFEETDKSEKSTLKT